MKTRREVIGNSTREGLRFTIDLEDSVQNVRRGHNGCFTKETIHKCVTSRTIM